MNWLRSSLRIADFTLIDMVELEEGKFDVERSLVKKVGLGFNVEHFRPYRAAQVAEGPLEPDWKVLSDYIGSI